MALLLTTACCACKPLSGLQLDGAQACKYQDEAVMASFAYHEKCESQEDCFVVSPPEQWRRITLSGQPINADDRKTTAARHPFSGLDYDIWQSQRPGEENKYVFAFRGSEGLKDPGDWLFGNLMLVFSPQYILARRDYETFMCLHPNAEVHSVGHSLGGGIALSISVPRTKPKACSRRVPPARSAVVFNPSPRMFDGRDRDPPVDDPERVMIYQEGEFLGKLRAPFSIKLASRIKRTFWLARETDPGKKNSHRHDVIARKVHELCSRHRSSAPPAPGS